MAPRILIFSIAMGAKYLSYVKSNATFALTFFGYIISVLASVSRERLGGRAVIYHFPPTYHFDQKMKRVGTKGKILRFPAATNEGAIRECGCIDK